MDSDEARLGPKVCPHPLTPPYRTTLVGRFIWLEPLDLSHVDDLYSACTDDSLWDFMFTGPFPDLESFQADIEAKILDPHRYFAAIISQSTNKTIGCVCLMRLDLPNRVVEVGHVLFTPNMQRTPGGTEVMYLLFKWVFEDLGFRRLEWKTNNLNEPSKRAALRYGFTFEGVFRQHMIQKGRNRDTAWFSLIDGEWPKLAETFVAWLKEDNFGEDGRQKQTLAEVRRGVLLKA